MDAMEPEPQPTDDVEARLYAALYETLEPYLCLSGINAVTIGRILWGATTRLSAYHGVSIAASSPIKGDR